MVFFFFNDTATTEIYTLSLHDALPIFEAPAPSIERCRRAVGRDRWAQSDEARRAAGHDNIRHVGIIDRKSTRLNSSHANISYAVFCLKKKTKRMSRCRSHMTRTTHC